MPASRPLAFVPLALSLLLPAAALGQAAAASPAAPAPARTIRVSGDGRVMVPPDVARVLVGAVTTGKDLGKVSQDAAAVLRKVLAELGKVGVAPKDVLTTRHDLQVERPWSNGKPGAITGYTITDQVQVTVRDLGKLGAVLDQVTKAGGNTIDQLALEKDELGPDRARALALAYGAARAKAEALARAAGVTLGEVLTIEESSAQRPVPVMRANRVAMMAEGPQGAPVSAGDVEVTGLVDVTFAIR